MYKLPQNPLMTPNNVRRVCLLQLHDPQALKHPLRLGMRNLRRVDPPTNLQLLRRQFQLLLVHCPLQLVPQWLSSQLRLQLRLQLPQSQHRPNPKKQTASSQLERITFPSHSRNLRNLSTLSRPARQQLPPKPLHQNPVPQLEEPRN